MRSQALPDATDGPLTNATALIGLAIGSSLCALLLLGFGWLAMSVLGHRLDPVDETISRAVYAHRTPARTALMLAASHLGGEYFIPLGSAVIVGVCWKHRHRRMALVFGGALTTMFLIHLALKDLVGRSRPSIDPLIYVTGESFPSGHSMNSLVFYAFVGYAAWRFLKPRWLGRAAAFAMVPLVVAIGFSRVYLGAHYPVDVAAGLMLGLAWVGAIMLVVHMRALRRALGEAVVTEGASVEGAARAAPAGVATTRDE